jgi:hypothetical protein
MTRYIEYGADMMIKRLFFLLFLFFVLMSADLFSQQPELEIRTNPENRVYRFETNSRRGYYNLLIQNITCINRSRETITLEKGVLELSDDSHILQSVYISGADMEKSARQMKAFEQQGTLKYYGPFLGLNRIMKEGDRLSTSPDLEPHSVLVSMWHYLTFKGEPRWLTIHFEGRTASGNPVMAEARLEVVQYQPARTYIFPVRGLWYVADAGDAFSGHRWVGMESFALDLGQLGAGGKTHQGNGERVEGYYCFNKEVVAVADGDVIEVRDGLADDSATLQRENETDEDYESRVTQNQMKLLQEDLYLTAGNYLVIRHAPNEYSHYAHLKRGSIRVKPGDRVRQGQVVAAVGHSGNSTEPHLHFSINDGPDFIRSSSLPVMFSNINTPELNGRIYLHAGDMVKTNDF